MENERGFKAAKEAFPDFDVVDADDTYFSIRRVHIAHIGARVDELGIASLQVEKYGQRTKLFRGKNAVSRVRKYLGI